MVAEEEEEEEEESGNLNVARCERKGFQKINFFQGPSHKTVHAHAHTHAHAHAHASGCMKRAITQLFCTIAACSAPVFLMKFVFLLFRRFRLLFLLFSSCTLLLLLQFTQRTSNSPSPPALPLARDDFGGVAVKMQQEQRTARSGVRGAGFPAENTDVSGNAAATPPAV